MKFCKYLNNFSHCCHYSSVLPLITVCCRGKGGLEKEELIYMKKHFQYILLNADNLTTYNILRRNHKQAQVMKITKGINWRGRKKLLYS
jgi:hypothetical protein